MIDINFDDSEEAVIFGYIIGISIILLCFINYYFSGNKFLLFFNFVFLSESTVLTFFFAKAPYYHSIWLFLLSIYFLHSSYNSTLKFQDSQIKVDSIFTKELIFLFPSLGVFLFFCVIFYEFLAGFSFNSTGLLVLVLSILLIVYNKLVSIVGQEIDFVIIFLGILGLFFIFPSVIYKIIYGKIGQTFSLTIWDESFLVHNLLGKPLVNLLTLLGYNVLSSDSYIFFEDNEAGILRQVSIAKSCAGITSIQVFTSALISYVLVQHRKFDSNALGLVSLGIVISYIANLLRMALVVLSGHYWGLEIMLIVHRYAGWLIFTFWVFLFFIFVERVYSRMAK